MNTDRSRLSMLAYAGGFSLWMIDAREHAEDVVMQPGFFREGEADALRLGDVAFVRSLSGVSIMAVASVAMGTNEHPIPVLTRLAGTGPKPILPSPVLPPVPISVAPLRGCICPPRAEETCRNMNCARKGMG